MSQLSPRAKKSATQIDKVLALRIAGHVPCDPRTVTRYFAGLPGRIVSDAAIQRAIQALGVVDPRA